MVTKSLDYVTAMSSMDTEKQVVQFRFVTNVKHSIKCLSTRRVLLEQQNYNVRTAYAPRSSYSLLIVTNSFIHFASKRQAKQKQEIILKRARLCVCV